MRLSLIGMSGAGKSYWSRRMEYHGYRRFSCDEMIAELLGPELQIIGKPTQNLAKWMGQPYSVGYAEAEALYLQLEGIVIMKICDELENFSEKNTPLVVDTTGSLVYLEKKLLQRLHSLTQTVHLKLPTERHEQLFEAFLNDPKPMIWKGKYIPQEGENPEDTLRRSYRELISFRNERYTSMAKCNLDYSFHHNPGTNIKQLLELIGNANMMKC